MIHRMTPAYRQCLLKEKGVTQKQIAEELDVCEMSISKEINGDHHSHRVRCAIAEKIGMPVNEVFPDYYKNPPKRRTSKLATAAV
jgi:transcriptional regulator with XRE-family HTH domain